MMATTTTRKTRSASVDAPSYASSMQEKLQQNVTYIHNEKTKHNIGIGKHKLSTSQPQAPQSPPSSFKSSPPTQSPQHIQVQSQANGQSNLPPQLVLQMQMQTLLRPYLQILPLTPKEYTPPSELPEIPPASEKEPSEPPDITEMLQQYSNLFAEPARPPSLLSREPPPKKVHRDTELTFHPTIDEKSAKLARNSGDLRDRTEALYELNKEIAKHKEIMRKTFEEQDMRPYTFAPQISQTQPSTPEPKGEREVVNRLYGWEKERNDKIERLRMDNQVLQVTNDLEQCTFVPAVEMSQRSISRNARPTPSPGVDKFIDRHARARFEKEERNTPVSIGDNWTPELTQPKEFNFMIREKVKGMLHHDEPPTHSRSLPTSPLPSRRANRHSISHPPSHSHSHTTSSPTSPSTRSTPHSLRSSMSDLLDAPLKESDTRNEANIDQLRYNLSDYTVEPNPDSSTYESSQAESNHIIFFNDNKIHHPRTPPPMNYSRLNYFTDNITNNTDNYFSDTSCAIQSQASTNDTRTETETETETETLTETETELDDSSSAYTQQSERVGPPPQLLRLSQLNSNGRPNSAPPVFQNNDNPPVLKHSGSLQKRPTTPAQKHQNLLLRIQQQQHHQQQQLQQQKSFNISNPRESYSPLQRSSTYNAKPIQQPAQ